MDKEKMSEALMRAISRVDDKYVEESLIIPASAKASVSPLKKHTRLISAIAAAAALVIIGGVFIRFKNLQGVKHSERASLSVADMAETEACLVNETAAEDMAVNEYTGSFSYNRDVTTGDIESNDAESCEDEMIEADGAQLYVEEDPGEVQGHGVEIINPMTAAQDLNELYDLSGIMLDAPDFVGSSVACDYYYEAAGSGLVEVLYLDEDTNVICSIRKSFGNDDISGVYIDYEQVRTMDVADYSDVIISGNGGRASAAVWSKDGYSYSIYADPSLAIEDMTIIIGLIR